MANHGLTSLDCGFLGPPGIRMCCIVFHSLLDREMTEDTISNEQGVHFEKLVEQKVYMRFNSEVFHVDDHKNNSLPNKGMVEK
jgi:hypothetical protein